MPEIWETWPESEERHRNYKCPHCGANLRAVKLYHRGCYSEAWDCVCVNCREKFLVNAPEGVLQQESVEEFASLLRVIDALQEKIIQLQAELNDLKGRRTQFPDEKPVKPSPYAFLLR